MTESVRQAASALLVVDVQRDFCEGGSLAVPDGDRVVPVLNDLMHEAARRHMPVYASRDWHPARTSHFEPHGGDWPVHCVQGSTGAEFHPDLELPPGVRIVSKGDAPDADGYSAFDGHTEEGQDLAQSLAEFGVTHLYVGGLATDYCVRASVLDARRAGLAVTVIEDAIAAVDRRPGDGRRALTEMADAGASIHPRRDVLS